MKRLSLLLVLVLVWIAIPPAPAQENGIAQTLDLVTMPTGEKLVRWQGITGRSYFLQASTDPAPLAKWSWAPIIENGNDEPIHFEIPNPPERAFFRLKYTDQLPGPSETLDTADFDNDGLSNLDEIMPPLPLLASAATDPLDPDTDQDGLPDGYERTHGFDANDDGTDDPDNGPTGDPDGDRLTNAEELALGTNPANPDTDGDGLTDGEETALTTNPNHPNTDGDSLLDGEDADPKEILVDWQKTPESYYILIDVEVPNDSGSAQDLNDKAEVLFGSGIWAGGTWIPKIAPEITGIFPGSISETYPDGIGYTVPPRDWDFFNNDRQLLQIGYVQPTDGPGVDSSAPSPVFWADGPSSSSLIYETAGLWDQPYWRAWPVGISSAGEMVVSTTPFPPPGGSTPTERLDRFNASGVLVGSMDGSGGFHPDVRTSWTQMVSASGWVTSRLRRKATATEPAAEKLGLWNAANTLVTLPPEADGRAFPVQLNDLPNSSVALVAEQVTATSSISRVFLPDADGQMRYSARLSDQKLQLFAGDGTAMTSDGNLWRNGKLIPLRDLCPKIGELLDAGCHFFPLKANKHGTYLIQAEDANGQPLPPKLLVKVDIVPDDNMAGVVGDIVESVNPSKRIKHFVSPKKDPELVLPQEFVVLKATGITAEQITPGHANQIAEWDGGEAVPGEPLKRRVPRQHTGTDATKVKIKQGGAVTAEMYVWILWSDVTSTKGNAAFSNFLGGAVYGVSQQPTEGWRFVFKIQPVSILDQNTLERPKLSGLKRKDPPGAGKTYTISPPLGPGDSANYQWDVSRQYQVTIRNPGSIPRADLQQGNVAAAWIVNQPDPDDTPITYPSLDVEGNDDPATDDEDNNPYKAMTNNPKLNHQMGELSSEDAPILRVLDGWGAAGRAYSVEMNFKEFARVELWDGKRGPGRFWFRISDHIKWHHYLDATYDDATSQWKKASTSSDLDHPKP